MRVFWGGVTNENRAFDKDELISLESFEIAQTLEDINILERNMLVLEAYETISGEVQMEGFKEAWKNFWKKIGDFFKWLWDKIKAFGKWISGKFKKTPKIEDVAEATTNLSGAIENNEAVESAAEIMDMIEEEKEVSDMEKATKLVSQFQDLSSQAIEVSKSGDKVKEDEIANKLKALISETENLNKSITKIIKKEGKRDAALAKRVIEKLKNFKTGNIEAANKAGEKAAGELYQTCLKLDKEMAETLMPGMKEKADAAAAAQAQQNNTQQNADNAPNASNEQPNEQPNEGEPKEKRPGVLSSLVQKCASGLRKDTSGITATRIKFANAASKCFGAIFKKNKQKDNDNPHDEKTTGFIKDYGTGDDPGSAWESFNFCIKGA